MDTDAAGRARRAATELTRSLGLPVDEVLDLHDSTRLTVRLLPCDLVARIAPADPGGTQLEIDRAARLTEAGAPVGGLDPRVPPQVHRREGFEITLWTHHAPRTDRALPPGEYAAALIRLHTAMRSADISVPSFTSRVDSALALVEDPERTPRLTDPDRAFLRETLLTLGQAIGRRGTQQPLHGEPHPGNLLDTPHGPLFIDLETCCSGPVELDLAHAPAQVAHHYPGVDHELLRDCRILARALAATWRWDREDSLPDGHLLGIGWLQQVGALMAHRRRADTPQPTLTIVCGLPGSGKTTEADRIIEATGAARLSADEWMTRLGGSAARPRAPRLLSRRLPGTDARGDRAVRRVGPVPGDAVPGELTVLMALLRPPLVPSRPGHDPSSDVRSVHGGPRSPDATPPRHEEHTTMQHAQLGRTGATVSRLVLGTMNFGPHTEEEDAFAIMDRALDAGVTFFDTANVYGGTEHRGWTEEIVGRWLATSGRRNDIVLATKVFGEMGPNANDRGLSALNIRRAVDESLRRLQTDHIDLYQMHHVDRSAPWEEIWQAMDLLIAQGKITYVGSSNFAGWHLAQANEAARARHTLGLVAEQSLYNLLSRSVELEVLPAAEHYGLGVIAWSPLAGGKLGGRREKGVRRENQDTRFDTDGLAAQLDRWETFCEERDLAPGEAALAWLLHRPGVLGPIIGPRTMEQLDSAIAAVEISLSEDDLAALDEIFPGPGGPAPEAYAW